MVLTLASQSPRRRELLAQLGVGLEIRPAHTDEAPLPGESAAGYVRRLASEKARAIPGETVLGADTTVVLDGAILGKPADEADAHRMLRALAGRRHEVVTGVCVRRGEREESIVVSTAVQLVALTEEQIAWYVATGEPLDKAGAYAVQGIAGAFVSEVQGSISNVVGLPLTETVTLLGAVGFRFPWTIREGR